jgi:hypothetical protein
LTTAHPEALPAGFTATPLWKRLRGDGTGLANGALLKAAEEAGFDLLLSTDKNI